jgi:hypothetical protein
MADLNMIIVRYFTPPSHYDNNMINDKKTNRSLNGFTLIIGVLIMGAVAVAIVVAMLLQGVGSMNTSRSVSNAAQARAYADTCTEEAAQKLLDDLTYTGSQTITFSDGSCTIGAVSGSGNTDRTIQATGTVGTVTRRVEMIIATVRPQIVLTSWLEVATF